MSEHREPIPSMIYNAAVGGHVTNSQQIIDENENKEQSQINAEVKQIIGQGSSVNTRIANAINTEKTRAETAEQLLQEQYNALTQSDIVVGTLPESGTKNLIYRVPGTSSYFDYMWNGTQFIKMAEYDNAIDDEPTVGSDNLVKSGGVWNDTVTLKKYDDYPENKGWVNNDGTIVYNYGTHKVVKVKGGDVVKFKSGTYAARVFLLKTYTKPTGNITPDFSDTTPNNIAPLANQTCTITIPSDTHYLAFACKITRTGEDDSPVELFINGINIISGIIEQISEISDTVKNNKYIEKLYNINVVLGWPDESKVFVMNYGTHICLPVKEGDIVYNNGGNNYYLLNTYKLPSNVDNNPDFALGYDKAFVFNTNNESVLIPTGCNYIAIGIKGGKTTYPIDNLTINGVPIKERIVDIISNTLPLIEYSKIPAINGWVDSSNVFVINYGTHKVIPVKPGQSIKVITGKNSTRFFMLKSYTIPQSGSNTPDFSDVYPTSVLVRANRSEIFIIPSDTHYVAFQYVIRKTGENDSPVELFVDGIDYINGIIGQVGSLGKDEYWKANNYLNSIIQSKRRVNDVTRQNDSAQFRKHPPILTFAHFSDVHKEQDQIERVMQIVDFYKDYIDDVVYTGDAVDYYSDSFDFWNEGGAQKVLFAIGNHEQNNNGSYASQSDIYTKFLSNNILNWGVVSETGKVYYYKDYPLAGTESYELKGIRLIVLLPTLHHSSVDDAETQLSWFETTLENARQNGYAVIVAQHYPFEEHGVEIDCNFTAKNDLEWTDGGIYEDYVNKVQSFVTAGGEFITWLAGHVHRDEISKHSVTNQLCVDIANSSVENNYSDYTRDYKSVNRDCVNIISFDIYAKLIKIVRIGANMDYLMRSRNTICINYQTKEIVSQS